MKENWARSKKNFATVAVERNIPSAKLCFTGKIFYYVLNKICVVFSLVWIPLSNYDCTYVLTCIHETIQTF
jgi:hypothetical protein